MNSIIHPNVVIGKNVTIGNFCVIGYPAEHPGVVDPNAEPKYTVIIGDNTIIRDHVTINAGHLENTVIGSDCYIMSHVHIGHDARIGNKCVLHTSCVIGGHSTIFDRSRIGLNASLHQHTVIGVGCIVGAQSFVKGTWRENYRKIAGVPSKDIGFNTIAWSKFCDDIDKKWGE
jgi:UDP-N-acetylglucosamine acyltransferase